jgi:hypothetical protein
MRAIWLAAIAVNLVSMSGVLAQKPAEEPPPRPVPEEKATAEEERPDLTPAQLRELASTRKINATLDEETKIEAIEAPFYEVIRTISKHHKIPIVLDPEGLESVGVTADQLVNLKLDGISLRNALRTLLGPLHLGQIVRHEVLTITSLDCPERMATVRTFPLGNLLKRMDDPSELISTLEIMWPDAEEPLGDPKKCQPRARILAGHLVVRGSPRQLDMAEQLIDGLMLERPAEPEVKAVIKLPSLEKERPSPYKEVSPRPLVPKKPIPAKPPEKPEPDPEAR